MVIIKTTMKKCMETDKPLISILMAVYEPNMDWLKEQLISLNDQTYPNLRLYVRDDCSPSVSFEEIQFCVKGCISAFEFNIARNEKNLGSNKTFEQLTKEAEGDYFAYCDQDDVWLSEKLETLITELQKHNAQLVCSDVVVIDEQGTQTASSIQNVRPRHIFCSGENLAGTLIYRNFVIGCTMLIPAKIAKDACPFAKNMVHDHYLALYVGINGKIYSYPKPLIKYRIHDGNQTGVLSKISTKEDYVKKHMGAFFERIDELSKRFSFEELTLAKKWANARKDNYNGKPLGMYHLWKLRNVNKTTSLFELIGLRMPSFLFGWVVRLIQKGKI